ncbi:thioesterase [Mycolicibacterium komossense]|uniref:Thioesterase n=1 Tax=Mycolicibacterium komossense TaxID=1779 RepID=A0ABT3CF78_9MYCO|nr:thioesterase [Mycolicibacterium komossense]
MHRTVGAADTAAAWGPDFPAAASTPFVLSLAELVCHGMLADGLADDEITVGAGVELTHDRPSPVGATLTARATLQDRQGRKAFFTVEVTDDNGQPVAHVKHTRAVLKRSVIESALATG